MFNNQEGDNTIVFFSRSGPCWACLSTLPVKLNFRFLLLYRLLDSTLSSSLPPGPTRTLRPVWLTCLLPRPSSSVFQPLQLWRLLVCWSSRFSIVFDCQLVCLALIWFRSSESVVSDSSSVWPFAISAQVWALPFWALRPPCFVGSVSNCLFRPAPHVTSQSILSHSSSSFYLVRYILDFFNRPEIEFHIQLGFSDFIFITLASAFTYPP